MITHQISGRGRAVKVKTRATVVCFRGDRVLLVSKDGCKWSLPGGRPNKDESFADSAARELAEETTLSVKGLRFLYHVIGATTVHQVFAANIAKTAVAKPGKEIERCQWFSVAEMDEIVASTTTRQIVKAFLASHRG